MTRAARGAAAVSVVAGLGAAMEGGASRASQDVALSAVWAVDMPGTIPMRRTRRGEPLVYDAPEGRLADEILRALGDGPPGGRTAGACFAVPGTGMAALRAAHAVLALGGAPPDAHRRGEPLSVVFFSRPFGAYVHLVGARRAGGVVRLTYRFVPHETREVTAHLALIPIAAPARGALRVTLTRAADAETRGGAWDARGRQTVCGPFALRLLDGR